MLWMTTLLGCLSVGDSVPQNEFAESLAPAFCSKEKECSRGLYQSQYYDRADCIATWEVDLALQLDILDERGCGYDDAAAAALFDGLLEMSCEAYYEGEELAELSADVFTGCEGTTGGTTTYYYYGYEDY